MDDAFRKEALGLCTEERFVYVSTTDPSGFPETRVLFNMLAHRSLALKAGPAKLPREFANYLATNASSRKVAQMRADPRVCLYYSDNEAYKGCSIKGRVTEVTDPAIRAAVWTDDWNMYYPGGLNGGDFALFLFSPETVRYYHGLAVHEFDA